MFNQHSLRLRTGDISALEGLVIGVLELKNSIRLVFTPKSLILNESVCDGCVLINGQFDSNAFTEFTTTGSGVLCFNELEAQVLRDALSKNGQRDELVLIYDKKKRKQVVELQILRESKSDAPEIQTRYQIPIVNGDRELMELDGRANVDYGVKVQASHISEFIRYLKDSEADFFENDVTLRVSKHRFEIEKVDVGGGPVNHARLVLQCESSPHLAEKRVVAATSVSVRIAVQHLRKLLKLFSLATRSTSQGDLWIYIAKDQPVVFEVQVGALGTVSASIAPKL